MICEYCRGTGEGEHGAEDDDCVFCFASGRATCIECGADADLDNEGDYFCASCFEEFMLGTALEMKDE